MNQQMDSTINAEIQGLVEKYEQDGLEGLTTLITKRINNTPATDSIYLLTTFYLEPIVGNLDRWPKNAIEHNYWMEFDLVPTEDTSITHLVRAKRFQLPGKYGLLVGKDIFQLTEAKRRIIQALSWGVGIMLFLAFVGGGILSRRTVRKIEKINQTTRSIMSGDLSRRVAVTGRNDDLDQVAANMNAMLDRIQTLMEDVRKVSDNIAHDLRTPLARLRQQLDDARRQEAEGSVAAKRLEKPIQEVDSLLSTFSALLRIARIEASQTNSGIGAVNYHDLLTDIIEFYEPLIEEKYQAMTIHLEPDIQGLGDRDMLFQSISNILENSIKYTPEGGQLSVSLTKKNQLVSIVITDNGPGIPEAERKRVFKRFYRLDKSRTTSGNGLGLSMVSAVVALHNGTITLDNNDPGLKTIITLPQDLTNQPNQG